jgi:hypothetical protein
MIKFYQPWCGHVSYNVLFGRSSTCHFLDFSPRLLSLYGSIFL